MHTIAPINTHTAHAAAALAVQLWPDSDQAAMEAHFTSIATSDGGACFLLQQHEAYIGFIELSIRNDYVEGADALPVAYIEGLFIQSTHRQQGLGLRLLQHAEAWAISKGFTQLCSDAELDNHDSIGFHAAAGFTETSRIVCFVKNIG